MITQFLHTRTLRTVCIALFSLMIQSGQTAASSRSSTGSGLWGDSTIWGAINIPLSTDNITISPGDVITLNSDQTIHNLTVSSGSTLTWSGSNVLTITGTLTVNGTVIMNGGDISLSLPGTAFVLGAGASFTWDPATNTSAGATLFTNGTENFSSTSTLIIKKWYNYAVPIGSVVTGSFGNLTLNSVNSSNAIVEWNQNNYFQSHQVTGTLTVDQGWITLDKSGSITNTTIGNIALTSVNSTFYGHNGTHPSSFMVNTTNITNNGGNLYMLNDGNGNVTLNVTGNFTNIGNVKIINNSGVAGVSNGNATLNVTGTFSQTTGDTRIIYNIATLNSGTFNATFGYLVLSGGIFMGQTACHTSGGLSTLAVTNNFNVNFSSSTDKFRGASLSSIGATMNNMKLNITVGGTLSIAGTASSSEFTSSASTGSETVTINGTLQLSGSTSSFNYGTSSAAHNLSLNIGGNLTVAGGITYLSHNGGTTAISVSGSTTVTGGTLSVKGDTGLANIAMNGAFIQSGGNIYLHNNTPTLTTSSISMTVSGSFTQSGGTFTFDNNTSSGSASHVLTIAGPSYSLSGSGLITRASAGTGSVYGYIYFNRSGTISFSRTSSTHLVQQTKQVVTSGCTLDVASGRIQVSSNATAGTDFFEVMPGATVNLNAGQFMSGALAVNSGLQVDSGATLRIARTAGLYDGTSNAAINASNNLDYSLDPYSVVEYNGTSNQVLTGTGAGLATTTHHKYGILRINFSGNPNTSYVAPSSSNVYIRTQLDLAKGELNLNGNTLTIETGDPSAVTRTSGYVKSETNSAGNGSILLWKNMTSGQHEFPFGVNANSYIPLYFSPTAGMGGDVSISTRSTGPDNSPFPAVVSGPPISMIVYGVDGSVDNAMDRWWTVTANGFTADVTLSYLGSENTMSTENCCGAVSIQSWTSSGWTLPLGIGTGTTTSTGTVTALNVTSFSSWVVSSSGNPLPIGLLDFTAVPQGEQVNVAWKLATEINVDHFDVERSSDGIAFSSIQEIKGKGNTDMGTHYTYIDKTPLPGLSYYRLRQTNYDGHFKYSETKAVSFHAPVDGTLTIQNFGPNPFDNNIWVIYEVSKRGTVNFQLTDAAGKVLHSEDVTAEAGQNRYDFASQTRIERGICFLNIRYNGQLTVKKLLKK